MTALVDVMKADAKKNVDRDGVAVTFIPGTGDSRAIKAFINPGGLMAPTQRTVEWDMRIQIAKADVPAINRNGDAIEIPAAWHESGTAKVMRVAKILDHDAAWWILGLKV